MKRTGALPGAIPVKGVETQVIVLPKIVGVHDAGGGGNGSPVRLNRESTWIDTFVMHDVIGQLPEGSALLTASEKTVPPGSMLRKLFVTYPSSLTILYEREKTQPFMLLLKFMLEIGRSDRVVVPVFGSAVNVSA